MAKASKTRDCPYCKEEIRDDATKCKHCGSSVAPERPSHEGTCPYCKEQIHSEAIKCKHCKSDFRSGATSDCGCNQPQALAIIGGLDVLQPPGRRLCYWVRYCV